MPLFCGPPPPFLLLGHFFLVMWVFSFFFSCVSFNQLRKCLIFSFFFWENFLLLDFCCDVYEMRISFPFFFIFLFFLYEKTLFSLGLDMCIFSLRDATDNFVIKYFIFISLSCCSLNFHLFISFLLCILFQNSINVYSKLDCFQYRCISYPFYKRSLTTGKK